MHPSFGLERMNTTPNDVVTKVAKPKRHRLFAFAPSFWLSTSVAQGSDVTSISEIYEPSQPSKEKGTQAVVPHVSDHSLCTTCGLTFDDFEQQRMHFRSDWHKHNVQRDARGRAPLSEDEFDRLSDLGSHSSLSGTDEASDDENDETGDSAQRNGNDADSSAPVRLAERIEYRNPGQSDSFIVVYTASLPDQATLASLAHRGSWVVIMTGSGHFCAALWDVKGNLVKHKTFHRYTSRRKQGGSQSVADATRGNANRIRSAGATLRRYGEQALENEVHSLLKSWQAELESAQCIFIRASLREKRDLLYGWNGSPLREPYEEGRVRIIPIPTRRATLKEATRVYEELSTVVISTTSLLADEKEKEKSQAKPKFTSLPSKQSVGPSKPTVKGTDHLKKREDKLKPCPQQSDTDSSTDQPPPPPLDKRLVHLLSVCLNTDRDSLQAAFARYEDAKSSVFELRYFANDERFSKVDEALGLVGVAAIIGPPEFATWLMDNDVDPCLGASPYIITKNKSMRNALRRYWYKNPNRYDYTKAGFPSPLSDADVEAHTEKERAKRKKEKLKKKEKALDKIEAAKSPEQRARELRAAAAEARLLGNRCAGCQKSLDGVIPFERLKYKYCTLECLNEHRQKLNSM